MKVASDEIFHDCNNKIESSYYRDYCVSDTCAFAAATVLHHSFNIMFYYDLLILIIRHFNCRLRILEKQLWP